MSVIRLVAGDHRLEPSPERPLVMGIVNATPDSVSDSERLSTVGGRVEHAQRLVADGADLIDIGGESGRTDRPVVGVEEEVERVASTIAAVAAGGTLVSVDTHRVAVARAALAAGAQMINDVGGADDAAMAALAVDTGAALVLMQTDAPPKVERFPGYADVVSAVVGSLEQRMGAALERGVAAEQIVLDPGLDYGKRPDESVAVLRSLDRITALGRPVIAAVSRKYFLGVLTGRPPDRRLGETLAAIEIALAAGASIVRVHDVGEVRAYLEVRGALRSREPVEIDESRLADERLKWLPAGR